MADGDRPDLSDLMLEEVFIRPHKKRISVMLAWELRDGAWDDNSETLKNLAKKHVIQRIEGDREILGPRDETARWRQFLMAAMIRGEVLFSAADGVRKVKTR